MKNSTKRNRTQTDAGARLARNQHVEMLRWPTSNYNIAPGEHVNVPTRHNEAPQQARKYCAAVQHSVAVGRPFRGPQFGNRTVH